VIEKLNAALNKALATQAVKDRLAQGASEALGPTTPEQADAYGKRERAQWVPFIRALRIDIN
jgi:tripartite-type tricarboxylate transporter receptor subunit TctC